MVTPTIRTKVQRALRMFLAIEHTCAWKDEMTFENLTINLNILCKILNFKNIYKFFNFKELLKKLLYF